jgi:hypothetical protein
MDLNLQGAFKKESEVKAELRRLEEKVLEARKMLQAEEATEQKITNDMVEANEQLEALMDERVQAELIVERAEEEGRQEEKEWAADCSFRAKQRAEKRAEKAKERRLVALHSEIVDAFEASKHRFHWSSHKVGNVRRALLGCHVPQVLLCLYD